ncbi:MAG TPA: DUF892 family protein [Solirubrobacterales bacterium]|jgi:ferritin-like metal-binding protein YciE|nr:DUF892 family protein [Solirubrobacterales bacterium]
MTNTIEHQLNSHLEQAHAMEENIMAMLDGMIATSQDPVVRADFKRHKVETERHAKRIEDVLHRRGANRSLVKDFVGVVTALAKLPIDLVRPQQTGRNVRDAYATEHLEIATYELLERVAKLAGDDEVVELARANREDEEKMAERIANNWDRYAELSLEEAGVAVVEKRPATKSAASRSRASSASRSGNRGSNSGARRGARSKQTAATR